MTSVHDARPSSSPSSSATRARGRRRRDGSGTFLPTKSARIGSSRWPRSTSTARLDPRGRPKSMSASIAARIVRPVNSTSSTSTTVRAGDVEVDPRLVHLGGLGAQPDVVAVERDVEHPDRDVRPLDPCDLGRETPREVVAAVRDPDERRRPRHPCRARRSRGRCASARAGCRRRRAACHAHAVLMHVRTPPRACEEARRCRAASSVAPFPASRDRT